MRRRVVWVGLDDIHISEHRIVEMAQISESGTAVKSGTRLAGSTPSAYSCSLVASSERLAPLSALPRVIRSLTKSSEFKHLELASI